MAPSVRETDFPYSGNLVTINNKNQLSCLTTSCPYHTFSYFLFPPTSEGNISNTLADKKAYRKPQKVQITYCLAEKAKLTPTLNRTELAGGTCTLNPKS
jgi:hypothetical protein